MDYCGLPLRPTSKIRCNWVLPMGLGELGDGLGEDEWMDGWMERLKPKLSDSMDYDSG